MTQEQKDTSIPKHVAIIMDGNRRWAKKKGLPVFAGHVYVVENLLERLIEQATKKGIEYITFWAWSTENWRRGEKEVSSILKLFRKALEKKAGKLIKNGARVRIIGDIESFPEDIRVGLNKMVEDSKNNTRVNVNFALNYGGREEIVEAIKKIVFDVKKGKIDERSINKKTVSSYLYTSSLPFPDPDLVLRTSGEERISNFLLWQLAYSELYFSDVYWPALKKTDFLMAIQSYQRRKRRYGK